MTSAPRTADDAFQDVLLGLFQLHGQVLEAADVMSGGFGLTGARWQVMKVAARQAMTVSQIARRLGLKRQSVQRTVDQLAEQCIVELQPNLDHLRAGLVALSDEGRRIPAALEHGAPGDAHLRLIASLSRRLVDDEFREALLSAPDEEEAARRIVEAASR